MKKPRSNDNCYRTVFYEHAHQHSRVCVHASYCARAEHMFIHASVFVTCFLTRSHAPTHSLTHTCRWSRVPSAARNGGTTSRRRGRKASIPCLCKASVRSLRDSLFVCVCVCVSYVCVFCVNESIPPFFGVGVHRREREGSKGRGRKEREREGREGREGGREGGRVVRGREV
jgi:hypothetical protein